jgi:hypothetical protein
MPALGCLSGTKAAFSFLGPCALGLLSPVDAFRGNVQATGFRPSLIGECKLSKSPAGPKAADTSMEKAHPKRGSVRITEKEADDVEERSSPRTPVIYEIVRRLGDEEMERPITSLWWSGVAAGLSISFSLLAQGILQAHLPAAPGNVLVVSLGYSVGFLMVVLSRQQLFTESTVTAVLPVMADFTRTNLWRLARLWSVVLLANMAGTLVAAVLCTFTPVLTPELRTAMLDIAGQMPDHESFLDGNAVSGDCVGLSDRHDGLAASGCRSGAISRHRRHHISDRGGGLHAYRGRKRRGIFSRVEQPPWRGVDGRRLLRPGAWRQYHRRHRPIRLDRLCAGHEGDIG